LRGYALGPGLRRGSQAGAGAVDHVGHWRSRAARKLSRHQSIAVMKAAMIDVRNFLLAATRHLCRPAVSSLSEHCNGNAPYRMRSWCCWTTFGRLECDTVYWSGELPLASELGEASVADGGSWGQPFRYQEIAHVIIPRSFCEEPWSDDGRLTQWHHEQDIDGLSKVLNSEGVDHNLLQFCLELKLY